MGGCASNLLWPAEIAPPHEEAARKCERLIEPAFETVDRSAPLTTFSSSGLQALTVKPDGRDADVSCGLQRVQRGHNNAALIRRTARQLSTSQSFATSASSQRILLDTAHSASLRERGHPLTCLPSDTRSPAVAHPRPNAAGRLPIVCTYSAVVCSLPQLTRSKPE